LLSLAEMATATDTVGWPSVEATVVTEVVEVAESSKNHRTLEGWALGWVMEAALGWASSAAEVGMAMS
jgi:hypothetical protein